MNRKADSMIITLSEKNGKLATIIIIHISILFFIYMVLNKIISYDYLLTQDVSGYYVYSQKIVQGQVPYHDFKFEYPPIALIPLMVPYIFTFGHSMGYSSYLHLFATQNMLYSLLIMLMIFSIVRKVQPERAVVPILTYYIMLSVPLCPFVFWHYDIFPSFLSVSALYFVIKNKKVFAGAMIGLCIAAKIYAIVFLPVYFLYYFIKGEWKSLFFFFFSATLTILIVLFFFHMIGSYELYDFFRYHMARGLQIESVAAGLVIINAALGIVKATINYNYGAWHISSPLAENLLNLLPFLFLLTIVIVMKSCYMNFRKMIQLRGILEFQNLFIYFSAVIIVFIIFNKVFSPQYFVWLLPFAVLLKRQQTGMVLCVILGTIFLNTQWIYFPLIRQELFAAILLNIRNFSIIFLFFWLLKDLGVTGKVA